MEVPIAKGMAGGPQWVRVRAVPADEHHSMWLVECNLCGVVELVTDEDSDDACLTHLEHHEVDTTPYRQQEAQSTETYPPPDDLEVPD